MGEKMGAKKEESAAKPTQITVMLRLAAGFKYSCSRPKAKYTR